MTDRCAGWRLIEGEPHDADVISQTLADSIREHQQHGADMGCWAWP